MAATATAQQTADFIVRRGGEGVELLLLARQLRGRLTSARSLAVGSDRGGRPKGEPVVVRAVVNDSRLMAKVQLSEENANHVDFKNQRISERTDSISSSHPNKLCPL